MTSLAASIPPELFKNILFFVGDEERLDPLEHRFTLAARREEMKHLSVCASTCVYWAQLTRERMFELLVLRSSKDLSDLKSLLRTPSATPSRIEPLGKILRDVAVYYTLGDRPWFHNVGGLKACGVPHLQYFYLHITGPATPVFTAASTRRPVLHPLFFASPRVLPVKFPYRLHLTIENVHLPNSASLFNLLQDCLSLHPQHIKCSNLTWDQDSEAAPSSSSMTLKLACRVKSLLPVSAVGCTDDVLAAAMGDYRAFPTTSSLKDAGDHTSACQTLPLCSTLCTLHGTGHQENTSLGTLVSRQTRILMLSKAVSRRGFRQVCTSLFHA